MKGKNPLQDAAAEIRAELEKILASPEFRTTRRGCEFLRYTVERVLAGQAESLKERTLAVDLFGRSPEADLEKDSSVRVCARHVRQRLAAYYASPAAAGCRWRIELPVGSYVPVFTPAADSTPAAAPSQESRWRRWALPALFAIVLAVSALVLWKLLWRADGPLNRLWAPAWDAAEIRIVLVSTAEDASSSGAEPLMTAAQACGAAELAHALGRRGLRISVSSTHETAAPPGTGAVVLLGPVPPDAASSWLGDSFPDFPSISAAGSGKNPPPAQIAPSIPGPGAEQEAVLYRIPPSANRPFLLILSGRSARATRLLASLVLDPASLSRLVPLLPAEWERRRLAARFRLRRAGGKTEFELLTARLW